jgi:cytochrome c biogenesis protein CcdA
VISSTEAAFALVLGAIAAFNPCGFALLPAYTAVIVTAGAEGPSTRLHAVRHAVGFGLAMTLGFVAVFAGFGLLFVDVNAGLQRTILPYLPYVTLALGGTLVALGAVLLATGELRGPGLRVTGGAPRETFASQCLYGSVFALASLSCTIGPFFTVVTTALAAGNPLGTVAPFLLYAIGMGTAVLLLSMTAALAGVGVAVALRRRTGLIMRIGGVVMILAGFYVAAFGVAEVLPQFGIRTMDPWLLLTARWQGAVSTAIEGWGARVLAVLVGVTAITTTVVLVATARRGPTSSAATAGEAPGADSGPTP